MGAVPRQPIGKLRRNIYIAEVSVRAHSKEAAVGVLESSPFIRFGRGQQSSENADDFEIMQRDPF